MSDAMPAQEYRWPSPPAAPEDAPFYAAAREGQFLIKLCRACGQRHWYPRPVCPHCFSSDTVWETASGRGVVYSHSTLWRADPPYTLAYVTLAEGPTMLTHLVDGDPTRWQIGQAVQVVFKPSEDGTPVPCFRPSNP